MFFYLELGNKLPSKDINRFMSVLSSLILLEELSKYINRVRYFFILGKLKRPLSVLVSRSSAEPTMKLPNVSPKICVIEAVDT